MVKCWGRRKYGTLSISMLGLGAWAMLGGATTTQAGDVKWLIQSSSTFTLTGDNAWDPDPGDPNNDLVEYSWTPLASGSTVGKATGYFKSTPGFLTTVDLGPAPVYTDKEDFTPAGLAITLAEVAAQHTVVHTNTGSYAPAIGGGPLGAPGGNYGTPAPANFAAISTANDPNEVPQEFGRYTVRDMKTAYWTRPGLAPPVNPTTGAFDAKNLATSWALGIDFNLPGTQTPELPANTDNLNTAQGSPLGTSAPNFDDDFNRLTGPVPGSIGRAIDNDPNSTGFGTNRLYTMSFLMQGRFGEDGETYEQNGIVTHDVRSVANLVPGDVNFDHIVDVSDIQQIAANYLGTGALRPGNANGDNIVDISDIQMIAANYLVTGGPPGGGATASVPEPGSFVLAALAGLGLAGVYRRARRQR
ncbi:MAG: PEP-CTERM sorting domain-containing protein [Planctomycetia bacterium]|nr:PEP-CTERM sorting domain-containing protein [Planctomycetia bacterium]